MMSLLIWFRIKAARAMIDFMLKSQLQLDVLILVIKKLLKIIAIWLTVLLCCVIFVDSLFEIK